MNTGTNVISVEPDTDVNTGVPQWMLFFPNYEGNMRCPLKRYCRCGFISEHHNRRNLQRNTVDTKEDFEKVV
ncbi:hypothetical protein IRJ41_003588 [Triplophysa rosa]|uniref:Uncharacterized protein n=1 Tax=Triplophysa rosa TaxID=992332 RepID=A0A9W7TQ50_TRIRA|nr:hypothetical protein IRJ41_003588 [Triplophysa rosa]